MTKRHNEIREMLMQHGRLGVEELASSLNVTTMTIRRDLTAMEKAGVLTRTHGGCVLRSPFVQEASFVEKDRVNRPQKLAIACEVVSRLRRGSTVYLDTGTTAVHVAQALPTNLDLRIFTNNLRVAIELFGREGVEVAVYGGMLGSRSPDLTGEMALTQIRQFHLDFAILGADAVDAKRCEFYSADMGTAMLGRAACENATEILLAADSSKFGKSSLATVGEFTPNMTLFSDENLSPQDRKALLDSKVTLVCVETAVRN